jgi:hypothetical protein
MGESYGPICRRLRYHDRMRITRLGCVSHALLEDRGGANRAWTALRYRRVCHSPSRKDIP